MQRHPRLFRLVNPTHMLAEGVQWSDGAVAVRWHDPHPNTSTWDNLAALQSTHTNTQLHWLPNTPPAVQPAAPAKPDEQTTTVWLPAPTTDGLCSRCGDLWPCLRCGP